MAQRLLVIDGADQGRFFSLTEGSTLLIGSSTRHADIRLNDLYVKRVHCMLHVGDRIVVKDEEPTTGGIFVNGQRVTESELRPGDVLRVGNSHLRLELDDGSQPAEAKEPVKEAAKEAAPEMLKGIPILPAERLEELAGHTFGHFEIAEVLGRGQCGVAFLATDLKANHEVTLKILPVEFPKRDTEMQRFARVLKEVLPIRHPHLVTVLGAGKTGPYCWIAREYVAGKSAAQAAQRAGAGGKVNWKEALRIAVHVGRALEFVHRRHALHGNVTPNNILIRQEDKVVKLADLMLAQALEGSALYAARLEGKLMAELPYLSPEQVDPESSMDEVSDLYGLGAVVYARLTGRPPFQGATPDQTLARIQGAPLTRPSQLQAGIPPGLEAAVVRLLARRPEDRFPTASALLAALDVVAAREGVAL
ncbi:MAG: protein kinase [Planctomycetes bacterium]|nr:protein kinase [Planctomycetota bacterium]